MSPQRSNRSELIEGTLRCLGRLPPEEVTARAITQESGANLASIGYHFGTKDALITTAIVEGLDRWLEAIAQRMDVDDEANPSTRILRAIEAANLRESEGLASNFFAAVARAKHDPDVQRVLTQGFKDARPRVAALLDLGTDADGLGAAGALIAMFHGLVAQTLVDPQLAIENGALIRALGRLAATAPQ